MHRTQTASKADIVQTYFHHEQEESLCQLKQRMPGQIFGQNSLQDVYIVSEYVGRKQHIVLDDMTNMENWKREQP